MHIDNPPFVSIIIVNFNGKRFLDACLKSLQLLSYPADKYEIILVDNASSDDSVDFVKHNFPDIRLLQLDKNYGFCKPNNEGVIIARGEYVVFLNNDTEVTSRWLSELVGSALTEKDIVSCASKILYIQRRNVINAAGGKLNIIGGGMYTGYGDKDGEKYEQSGYTGFGCGAGVLVKKDFFQYIGGFDEDYFASCEENDLGWKAWLLGYKVYFTSSAVMYHEESGTFGDKSTYAAKKVYYITRNRLYNIYKNIETHNLFKAFFISTGFNCYRSFKYLFQGNFAAIDAVIKGHIDFLKTIDKMKSRRRFVKLNRKRSDKELYKLGVIASLKESILEEFRISRVLKDSFYTN